MSTQQKGFRQAKQKTKAQLSEDSTQLKTSIDQLGQQVRFMGQQMFQQLQQSRQMADELVAAINLLRLNNVNDVQNGDTVMLDTVGVLTETGRLFKGGYLMGTVVKVGSKNFVAGFEDALLGMQVGDTKDISITFPADYPAEELKGKAAKFTTRVIKVWRASENDNSIANLQKVLSEAEALIAKNEEVKSNGSEAQASSQAQ
jgi:hypothetical protein